VGIAPELVAVTISMVMEVDMPDISMASEQVLMTLVYLVVCSDIEKQSQRSSNAK